MIELYSGQCSMWHILQKNECDPIPTQDWHPSTVLYIKLDILTRSKIQVGLPSAAISISMPSPWLIGPTVSAWPSAVIEIKFI